MQRLLKYALSSMLFMLPACGSDEAEAEGNVSVRAYGESFIEDGIPAEEVGDGWALDFSRFVVTIRDVVVAGVALADPDPVDVSISSNAVGHELGTLAAPAGDHTNASFSISRVEIEGSAVKDTETKYFDWVFDGATHYGACETSTRVTDGGSSTFQITIHADHLLYDSLVAAEPQVLFQAFADADADANGVVTEAELGATDIGAYDPGNEDIDDLWTWLLAQHRTLGHVDGEGHCEATATDG